mgnify:CR=1 FL=1
MTASSLAPGAFGAAGGVGGLGAITTFFGGSVSTVSEMVQVKGGMFCRMPLAISSSSESSKKRFQLIETSQLA